MVPPNTHASTSEPVTKKIQSCIVDATFKVGQGANMKEHNADGCCLSRASPECFDDMLSSNMTEGVAKMTSF